MGNVPLLFDFFEWNETGSAEGVNYPNSFEISEFKDSTSSELSR